MYVKREAKSAPLFSNTKPEITFSGEGDLQNDVQSELRYEMKVSLDDECKELLEEAQLLLSSSLKSRECIQDTLKVVLREFVKKHSPRERAKRRAVREEKAKCITHHCEVIYENPKS